MLFHVTMTHTPENCPAELPPDKLKKFFAQAEKMQKVAQKKTNIKIHFMVGGVGHTMYALIEADTFDAMNMFFSGMGFKQDYQIEPVGHVKDIMAAFKAKTGKK